MNENIEDDENIDWLLPQPHRAPHRPYYWLVVGKLIAFGTLHLHSA